MNKIYRIVFNTTTGRWVVASEVAKGRGKAGRSVCGGALALGAVMLSGGAGAATRLTNVAAGTSATDAVNVQQLEFAMAAFGGPAGVGTSGEIILPNFQLANANILGGTTGSAPTVDLGFSKVDNALGNLGGRLSTAEGNVTNLQTTVNNINSGTVGLVQQDATTRTISVAKGSNGTLVDFTGTAGARKLTGVSAGTLSAGSTDAVNGAQLNTTNTNVTTNATNISALGGRVTTAEGNITNLGSQLTTTNNNVTNLGSQLATTNTNVTNVTGRVTTAEGNITSLQNTVNNINGGTAGLVQQDATTRTISVAKGSNGTLVDFTGTAGARKLTGVSAGTLSATSTDAVNGTQLNTTNTNVTNVTGRVTTAEGNIASVQNTVNSITSGGGVKYFHTNTALADSTTTGADSIAIGGNAASDGKWSVAVGTNSKATGDNSVALGNSSLADRVNSVSVGNSGTQRQIINLAKGTADTDAVNVSQLKGVTTALGGSAGVNADGTIKAPSYTIQGQANIADLGTALGKLDTATTANATNITGVTGRVTTAEGNITSLQNTVNNINSGSGIKYVHTNSILGDSVASGTNATAIGPLATASGSNSIVIGNAASTASGNAVVIGPSASVAGAGALAIGEGSSASSSGSSNGASVALGAQSNASGDYSTAVGSKSLSAGDAASAFGINANASGSRSVAVGASSTVSGSFATAVGTLSSAGGANASAFGTSANASAANSVALGAGSTTTATLTTAGYNPGSATLSGTASTANGEVSIGKSGSERRLTNLAAGSAATDAVNVSQLQAQDATVDLLGANAAARLGGGAAYTATTGAITAPSYALTNANAIAGSTGAAADVGAGFTKVDNALGNLGGRVTTAEGNITNLQNTVNNINSGGAGLVQQDATTRTISVAKGSNGTLVDFTGTAGARKLTGVSAGTLSATSTDAVNGTQLNTTNTNVTNVTGRVTTAEGNIASVQNTVNSITSGGGVKYFHTNTALADSTTTGADSIAIGGNAASDGKWGLAVGTNAKATGDNSVALGNSSLADRVNSVSVGNSGTQRQIINLAKGTADTDAVNVSQLKGVTTALGGSAGVNADGTIKAPSYTIQGQANIADVGSALGKLDTATTANATNITGVTGRVTTAEGNITNLQNTVNNISGSAGLVVQDATTRTISVGKGTDGTLVDFTGTAGARKLTGVSAGTLSGTSTDAVNGAQLNTTNTNVTNLGSQLATTNTNVTNLGSQLTTTNSNVTNLTNQINAGTAGLVQQDATTRTITVAKGSDGTLVDLTGTAGARKLTGVAAGTLSATSTDAVNGTQLNTTNANVTNLGSQLATTNTNVTNVTGRVTTAEGNITNLQNTVNNINSGGAGLVQQDATTRNISVAKGSNGTLVDFTGTAGARKLTGVSAGTLSVTSTDAVNGAQLNTTNTNVTTNATNIASLGGRVTTAEGNITNLGSQLTTTNTSLSNLQTTVNNINSGTAGLVKQDATTRTISVAKDTDGTLVDLTGTAGARKLTGVSAGTLSATSTDAVNGSQLNTTNQNVTAVGGRVTTAEGDIATIKTDATSLGGRVTTAEGNITNLQNTVNNISGSAGLVVQDATTRTISVGKGTDGTLVDFTGTAGARKLTGVSAGTLSATSADAVNGSQLFATNQNVTKNASDITALGGRVTTAEGNITNVAGRVTTVEGNVTNLQTTVNNISSSAGLVVQDATTRTISVGKGTDGTLVDLTGTAGARKLTGVSAGTLSATSADAVNGSQLFATNQNVTKNATDITAVGGRVTTTEGDIATIKTDATSLGGRVTTAEGNITNLQNTVNNINGGTAGLVQQDATSRTITVAKGSDGTLVDFTGTAGTRKLTGVSAGTLSATSVDAVNGSQLFATNQNVTKNTTDITALGGRVTTTEGDISNIKTDVATSKGDIATIKTDATGLGGRVTTAEGNITNLQNTVNNINGGTAGLVQQDATSRTISVGKGSNGTLVDFTGTAGARKLTGVSAGTLSATSTDAVNGAQLNTTNANVTTNATNIAALGGRVTTTEGDISTIKTDVAASKGDISTIKTDVATSKGDIANIKTDVTNIDGRVTTVEGNVTNLTTQINSGSVGLVKQDAATNVITVAKDTAGTRVDFTGTAGARTLTGLSAGALSATSTDAINGSQLFATNQNVTALGGRVTTAEGNITNLGSQLTTTNTNVTNLGSQLTTTNSNVSNLQTTVNNINSGTVGLVQQDATTRAISVAKDTDGRLVHFAGTTGARRLDGVDIGTLSATSTDAVNGSELYATNLNVTQNAADISTLGGRVTTAEGNISTIKTDVAKNEGDISTIKTDVATSKGDISAIKTDMANSQGDISNIRTDVTNIGGRVTNVEGSVTNITKQINSGSIGLVQQAAAGGKLTVGAGIDGNEVNFANNAGRARKLTRVASGTGAEDAVNVSQLKSVTDGLGGGASIDPTTGLVTGPTYSLTNADGSVSSVHTVGDALTNLDGRVYGNTNRINSLASQIGSGSVGLVQQASAGQKLTVGKDTDGSEVSFANAAGQARKLSGIAAGAVSATSTDAINGSQLQAVNQSVATALGGGSAVKADGTISAPTYSVTNADGSTAKVSGVEGAIGNLDGRVHDNTARIDNVETNVSKLSSKIDGAVGLVQQAAPGQQLTVGKANDGTSVNFTGTAGDRALTGVAAGKADNDAVNVSQLKAAGLVGANGELKPVLGYDGPDKNSVTLGGGNGGQPVAIHNVAAGVSDNDAVNVSQLNARLQAQTSAVLSQANGYTDDRFKSALREIDTLRSDVDDRFHAQDARIDRMGAMGTAMASMTASMSGVARDNRVGVGAGESNGRLAMAVGYQRAFRNGGATLTAGASFTDEDSSVGIGGGFGW